MRVVVAVDAPYGRMLGQQLDDEGIDVLDVVAASAPALAAAERTHGAHTGRALQLLDRADALVLEATRESVTTDLVAACDRAGVRIVPLVGAAADGADRLAAAFGLATAHPLDIEPWRLAEALRANPVRSGAPDSDDDPAAAAAPRVIAVWGAAGAPGRSTIAVELAVELSRGGRHAALVDADTHAPSIALSLGLADEGPGFAAACRQAELGGLDVRELTRISTPLGRGGVDVLTGLNRPSRWPELTATRVASALEICREWADYTVVDVAASLERDEEIVSDLEGPRRNAATLAALKEADLVVAVVGADPVGVSRFLRAYPELRATVGTTPVAVIANRLRPGTLGIDARGQVRRTLDRFGGIEDVWFVPHDARSADAALLAARPIAEVAPKSPLTLAVRRFVGEAVVPPPAAVGRGIRRSRRAASRAAA